MRQRPTGDPTAIAFRIDASADRDEPLTLDAISRRILAGFAFAAIVMQLHGWLTGGPGIAVFFAS